MRFNRRQFHILYLVFASLFSVSLNAQVGPRSSEKCESVLSGPQTSLVTVFDELIHHGIDRAVSLMSHSELVESERVTVWNVMFQLNGEQAIKRLGDCKFSNATLKTLWLGIAKARPELAGAQLSLYENKEDLFQLALALSDQISLIPWLNELHVFDESQRMEIFNRQIKLPAIEVPPLLSWCRPTTLLTKKAILLGLADKGLLTVQTPNVFRVVEAFQPMLDDLPEIDRADVAERVAVLEAQKDKFGQVYSGEINFKIRDPELKKRLVVAFLVSHINAKGWYTGQTANYHGLNVPGRELLRTQDLLPVIVSILKGVSLERLRERRYRDCYVFSWLHNNLPLVNRAFAEVSGIVFRADAIDAVSDFHGFEVQNLPLVNETEDIDLITALKNFAEAHPAWLPLPFLENLWEPVRNRDVVVRLLRQFFVQAKPEQPIQFPKSSFETLSHIIGIDASLFENSPLASNPGQFFELALDIQSELKEPAFSGIVIDPAIKEHKYEFLTLLRALRDHLQIRGNGSANWKKILTYYNLDSNGIKPADLDSLISLFQHDLVREVQLMLEGQKVDFSYNEFQKLTKKWGDLEPIWTLITRFQSKEKWKAEIPILISVFKSAIQDKFSELKFNGPADGTDPRPVTIQLTGVGVTGPSYDAWIKERAKLSLVEGGIAEGSDARLATETTAARNILQSNLLPHLQAAQDGDPAATQIQSLNEAQTEWAQTELRTFLSEEATRADPESMIQKITDEFTMRGKLGDIFGAAPSAHNLFHIVLEQSTREEATAGEIRGGARVLLALATNYPELQFGEFLKQIKEDLRSIAQAFKREKEAGGGGILLTAVSHAPKLLLTVGDLVQTASCQNYRTGGHIETLLGYVIDANVQVMATWVVKQQDFLFSPDYTKVARALAKGWLIQSVFDGNRRVLTISVSDPESGDHKYVTKSLGFAYLRQMLKLGHLPASNQPGLRLEREYSQSHPSMAAMQAQHRALLTEVANDMGAVTDQPLVSEKTRNPGGVYSDLANGVKTESYQIP